MPRGPSDNAAPTLLQRVPSNQRYEFHNSNNEVLNYFPLLPIVPVGENKKLAFLMVFVFFTRLGKRTGRGGEAGKERRKRRGGRQKEEERRNAGRGEERKRRR